MPGSEFSSSDAAAPRRRRRGGMITSIVAGSLVLVLAGYGVADAYDMVPGPLTTKPHEVIDPLPQPTAQAGNAAAGSELSDSAPIPATIAAALSPALNSSELRGHVGAEVRDSKTGKVLFSTAPQQQRTPASVTKILTSAAALGKLGAQHTFTTSVVASQASGGAADLHLVGGGDVLLSSGASQPDSINGRAGIATLADATAAQLKKDGVNTVTLAADLSRYGQPTFNSGWERSDIAMGEITPIVPLMIDSGRKTPVTGSSRLQDASKAPVEALAAQLKKDRIRVTITSASKAPSSASQLASVQSAPLADQVRYTLLNSDNVVAEVLGNEVAVAMGKKSTVDTGPVAVMEALKEMGLETGSISLKDTSGLNYGNRISPSELAGVIEQAVKSTGDLSLLVPNMPAGGLSGTLIDRYHDASSSKGAGIVNAKTGSLSTVNSLAGTVLTKDGRLLTFAFMSDGLKPGTVGKVRASFDEGVAAMSQCGCS